MRSNKIIEPNNLFKFATKELSQDAFISWCINFYNYKDHKLHNLSRDILTSILDKDIFDKIENIDIKRQFCTIDILLILTLNNGMKHYVIIEDKIDSTTTNKQGYLNIDKLDPTLNKNIKKINEIGIKEINKDNITAVLLKTGLSKNIHIDYQKISEKYKIKPIELDIQDLYSILKKYQGYSAIIDDFYKHLEFNLKINNQLENEGVTLIKKQGFITIDETIFAKNYYCYNCFIHLIDELKEEYTNKHHPISGGVNLRCLTEELSKKFKSSNNPNQHKIYVDTIRFNNYKGITNTFDNNKDIWNETFPYNKKESTIRYIFLFGKILDSFEKSNYVFLGLYRYKKTELKNNTRKNIWEKCNIGNKIPLNKNKLINIITEIEDNIANKKGV